MIIYFSIVLFSMTPFLFKQTTKTLFVACFLIWLFASLRCNFGDYLGYYNLWYYIQSRSITDIFYYVTGFFDVFLKNHETLHSEIGYFILSKIIPGNFFVFVSVTTGLYIVSAYLLIKRFVPIKYYYLAFILFLDPVVFLTNLSAIRQSLSLVCLLFSIHFIIGKKYIYFFLIIFLASMFHKSSIVFITLPILYYLAENKKTYLLSLIYISSPIILVVLFKFNLLGSFYGSRLLSSDSTGNYIYSAILSSLVLFAFYNINKKDKIDYFFGLLYLTTIVVRIVCLYPGGELISRYSMYIESFEILVLPLILSNFKYKVYKQVFLLGIILFFILRTILFFSTPGRIGEDEINFMKQNVFIGNIIS